VGSRTEAAIIRRVRPARGKKSIAARFIVSALVVVSAGAGASTQQAAPPASTPAATPAPIERHTRAWTRAISAPGVAAIAVSAKLIAVAGPESALSVYAAADGAPVWSSQLLTRLPPVIAGDVVVIASGSGVKALRAASGEPVWDAAAPAAAATALLATASAILLVSPGEVQAWRFDGSPLWTRRMATAPARAAAGDRAVYVSVPGPGIAALDLETGAVMSTVQASADTLFVSVHAGRLLVGSANGDLTAYKLAPSFSRDWTYRKIDATGPPAADARTMYATHIDNTLYAHALGSGNQRWSRQLPTRPRGGPILFSDRVIVVLADGRLAQYRANNEGAALPEEPGPPDESTRINSVGADPSGLLIVAIGVSPDESRQLIAWRAAPGSR
jgi:outer membrane protein assembly factor BamB